MPTVFSSESSSISASTSSLSGAVVGRGVLKVVVVVVEVGMSVASALLEVSAAILVYVAVPENASRKSVFLACIELVVAEDKATDKETEPE